MKTCNKCKLSKPEIDFYRTGDRLRSSCKTCWNADAQARRSRNGRNYGAKDRRRLTRLSEERASGNNPAKFIWIDSRSSDRKAGRDNDLTKEFIAAEVAKGCIYCGESDIRMTLDRIDNSKGHIQSNVVPACLRCNYTRKDMPYEAWLLVAKGMREARKAGLFNGWTGRVR